MIWVSRLLRVGIVATCGVVLSGIVPISLAHFQTGDACPNLGPIPACYLVSVCYAAMGLAALVAWRSLSWLFFVSAAPVILLAVVGTSLELSGTPTCPASDSGVPLCYVSLALAGSLLLAFLSALFIERKVKTAQWNLS